MPMPTGGVRPALAAVTLGVVLLTGCSDDGVAGSETTTTSEAPASTTTTQPPATDAEAVRPVIEDLAQAFDAVTAEVLVDPGQLEDEDSPLLADLEALLTADQLEHRLATYSDNAENGRSFAPVGSKPMWATFLAGEVVADGDDALKVLTCTTYHYVLSGPDVGEAKDGVSHPGWLHAERVEGTWKISRVDKDTTRICDPAAAEATT